MNVKEYIKKIEKEHKVTVIYVTEFGSTLYGTNSKTSDKDYKGIFLPNKTDLLLQKRKDNISFSSGDKQSRNTKDDVDIELWSIHKFFDLLKKGETGAIDMLFSMFREGTIVYDLKFFTNKIRKNYKSFLTKNSKAFVGYCLGQASKYGIKGSRLGDLQRFNKWLQENKTQFKTVGDILKEVEKLNLKYIGKIEQNGVEYLQVLGKLYIKNMKIDELTIKTKNIENKFGDRTKLAVNGIDWKALSHAVRVLLEFKELIQTGFIEFPLKYADEIKKVKYESSEKDLQSILNFISNEIKEVETLLSKSKLPDKVDNKLMESIILDCYL